MEFWTQLQTSEFQIIIPYFSSGFRLHSYQALQCLTLKPYSGHLLYVLYRIVSETGYLLYGLYSVVDVFEIRM